LRNAEKAIHEKGKKRKKQSEKKLVLNPDFTMEAPTKVPAVSIGSRSFPTLANGKCES
jgi:hypothetical protein